MAGSERAPLLSRLAPHSAEGEIVAEFVELARPSDVPSKRIATADIELL
jgi:hypothetical protein